ncbi:helix-turn-helix transcriptional regulator [Sandarakinorhabdus sp.]|uniref:helix-turn-helix transcriptional regulator n=1 Tax=Sandarakinorhabdus sp. TaxID=1916663 RepID=UPI00333ED17E
MPNINVNGELLGAHRNARGLSRAGLSHALLPARISEETIKRAEKGIVNPKKLEVISKFFQTNSSIFFSKVVDLVD